MVDLSMDFNKLSDSYQDLLLFSGDLVLTSDAYPEGQAPEGSANPILQDILQAIRMGLGEWFLDNTDGFPWVQQVFAKGADLGKIDGLMQNRILSRPGVTSLLFYESSANTKLRGLNIKFSAMTTKGRVDYSGTLSPTGGG